MFFQCKTRLHLQQLFLNKKTMFSLGLNHAPTTSNSFVSSLIGHPYFIECINVVIKGQRTYTNLITPQEFNKA